MSRIIREKLADLIVDASPARKHMINGDADPFVPTGWTVDEHRKGGQFLFDPATIELYLSPNQQKGRVIVGRELRKELAGKPVLNANVFDYLLAHPELIPTEWKGRYVYFWGTIYRDSDGNLMVRCLFWRDGRWRWFFDWLDNGWHDDDPAALRK